jgi:hypothetical protein
LSHRGCANFEINSSYPQGEQSLKNVLFALLIITVGCSQTANKNAMNSSNQQSSSTVSTPEPPLGRPNLPEPTLNDEAQNQADKMLSTLTKQCGQYYRVGIVESGQIWWPEITHPPTTSVEGEEVQARSLTEGDRLNGVDPRPIEWKGTMIVTFGPWRTRTTQLNKTFWAGWNDTYQAHFPMVKEKGKWHITPSAVNMVSFKCAEIPKEWQE